MWDWAGTFTANATGTAVSKPGACATKQTKMKRSWQTAKGFLKKARIGILTLLLLRGALSL